MSTSNAPFACPASRTPASPAVATGSAVDALKSVLTEGTLHTVFNTCTIYTSTHTILGQNYSVSMAVARHGPLQYHNILL